MLIARFITVTIRFVLKRADAGLCGLWAGIFLPAPSFSQRKRPFLFVLSSELRLIRLHTTKVITFAALYVRYLNQRRTLHLNYRYELIKSG